MSFLRDRPWIWIVVAWVVLIFALAWLIVIAQRYGPKEVPLDQPALKPGHSHSTP